MNEQTSFELAELCAQIALGKKAADLAVLDISGLESAPADYFIICTANSDVHARALCSAVEKEVKSQSGEMGKREGLNVAQWVIVDFFDVVVHIFSGEAREFYKLDKMWGDAKVISVSPDGKLLGAASEAPKKRTRKKAVAS